MFELGQSAWAGAPYTPSDRPEAEKDRSVSIPRRVGHVVRQASLQQAQRRR